MVGQMTTLNFSQNTTGIFKPLLIFWPNPRDLLAIRQCLLPSTRFARDYKKKYVTEYYGMRKYNSTYAITSPSTKIVGPLPLTTCVTMNSCPFPARLKHISSYECEGWMCLLKSMKNLCFCCWIFWWKTDYFGKSGIFQYPPVKTNISTRSDSTVI